MAMEAMAQAEQYVNMMEVAIASSQPIAYKLSLGAHVLAFKDVNSKDLEPWMVDQLDAGYAQLTGNQPGTAAAPNAYTTKAAEMADPSKAAWNWKKIGGDLQEGLGNALKQIGEGFTKGLGSTLIKVGVGSALLVGAYMYFKKKGVL